MLTIALLLLVAATPVNSFDGPDSLPQITLSEALERAARVDPDYVSATRQIADAAWSRRAAITAFLVPSLNTQLSATRYSSESFNIGTGALSSQIVDVRLNGQLNLFAGLSKFNELTRANAEMDGARANEQRARFATALMTETDYYDVIAQRELSRVAMERVRRAEEQFTIARARVIAGAAVQTDSLQLLLEVQQAQVALLRQNARLKVAQFQLARRIGAADAVDASESEVLTTSPLPLTVQQAVDEATSSSPEALQARASQVASEARVRSLRGSYFPSVDVFGSVSAFDESFFPTATKRSSIGITVSLPIWNNAAREISLSRATSERDVRRALKTDVERALRRDVVQAYEAHQAATAAAELETQSVIVALENLRVQEQRYQAGATTIIDLITAQVSLSEAEAELVQARFTTRLALSGLEAILGRRLF
jgi:outer membrane protein TolC